jgi:hypothetical protein
MNKKIPIKRITKFYDDNEYQLDINMGLEFLESDINASIILFRVDRKRTQIDDLYGESINEDLVFHPPIEVMVVPEIDASENKTYNNNGTLRYSQEGKLTFSIYNVQLEMKSIDITYGDYIGYQLNESTTRYFQVTNDGKKDFDNKNTIMGYKPTYRTITCAPVDETDLKLL